MKQHKPRSAQRQAVLKLFETMDSVNKYTAAEAIGLSAIAAHYGGFEFVGCELGEDYYKAAVQRFESATAQLAMFGGEATP